MPGFVKVFHVCGKIFQIRYIYVGGAHIHELSARKQIWDELEERIADLRRILLENILEGIFETPFADCRWNLLEIIWNAVHRS